MKQTSVITASNLVECLEFIKLGQQRMAELPALQGEIDHLPQLIVMAVAFEGIAVVEEEPVEVELELAAAGDQLAQLGEFPSDELGFEFTIDMQGSLALFVDRKSPF